VPYRNISFEKQIQVLIEPEETLKKIYEMLYTQFEIPETTWRRYRIYIMDNNRKIGLENEGHNMSWYLEEHMKDSRMIQAGIELRPWHIRCRFNNTEKKLALDPNKNCTDIIMKIIEEVSGEEQPGKYCLYFIQPNNESFQLSETAKLGDYAFDSKEVLISCTEWYTN
jgi:hypothetical protein